MALGDRLSLHTRAGDGFGERRGGAVLTISIERVAHTASTNADLLARLASGEHVDEGKWLIADRQTAGRGRLGRIWNDGQGNFMGSTVVRLSANDPGPATLALVAGVALARACARIAPAIEVTLKWPNDLLVGAAKCAGILMERSGDCVVVGVGVNLVSAPVLADRATASLADEGVVVDRDEFAETMAAMMTRTLATWRNEGLDQIISMWMAYAHPIGTALRISEQGIDGSFAGLAPDGALCLRCADGSHILVHAGDVELSRPEKKGS